MNKRRCVAYHTKTPGQVKARSEQQKVKNKTPTVRASKKAYNKSANEFRKNSLHTASIAMENPQWTPKLVFPSQEPSVRRISESMTIPDVHGSPLYIRTSDEVDSDGETPVATAHYSARRQNVTPGQRKSLQNRRNRLFESTIGRKAKGDTPMNASEIEATMSAPMNASCNTPHTQPSVAEDGMPKKRHPSDVSAQTQEPMVEDGNIPDSLFESTIGRKAKGDTHDVMDSRAINNGATEIESTMSAPINASCNTTRT